jgi:sterol desaturase/sphingolipid hydroxylase (fatty acid hydroxylase superfamily)
VIPFYLSYYLCSRVFDISPYMISMLYISKIYIELCGHSGKDIRKVGSFVQCIWIPQLFSISLYTIDHDNHHRWNHFNYGKRFSLWDRVFGTYKGTL